MSATEKIEKLFGVLTLTFIISYGWGCEMKAGATAFSETQKRKSLFRLGLDRMSQILGNQEEFSIEIRALLDLINRPKYDPVFVV
jgi:hypothetical protein